MSSVTIDCDIYPRQIMSGQTIRCFDKTVVSGISEVSVIFEIGENKAWTVSSPPSTHLNLANADTLFTVGEQVVLDTSAADLPLGLASIPTVYYVKTATSTYLEVSLTDGGAAVQYTDAGTGTFSISHGSAGYWNPSIKPCPVTTTTNLNILMWVTDSAGTRGTITKNNLLRIYPAATAVAKPTATSIYGRVSIFVYDSTNATAINRLKSTNNALFFQNLKVTGAMTRAGEASFKVYDTGSATATEKGLLEADKNVAIILGHNVIWSGKIKRATQDKMSLFDSATPASSWTVECESDISKMRKQNVKAANQGSYKAPVGYIISKLVENDAATDIDWRGLVETSLIGREGPDINFTVTEADMYDQFITLANFSGYDWRTRNNYVKYLYGASGYDSSAKTVTLSAIAPYTTNSFAGRWLLFVNDVNGDTTANAVGVKAYGKVTSNTTTVITMTTITNATVPPASSNYVIILGDPVLDFASDIRQSNYQATFTANKARVAALQNAYEMNDKSDFKQIATKVTAKGKSSFVSPIKSQSGQDSTTLTATLVAKDVWDDNAQYPAQSTWITQKSSAWVYSYAANASTVVLIGHDLILKDTEDIYFHYVHPDGTTGGVGSTISGTPTEQVQVDGTPTTTVTAAGALDTDNWTRHSVAYGIRVYVKDNSIITSTPLAINIGTTTVRSATGTGLDAVYGPYIETNAGGVSTYDEHPHLPGCLVCTQANTEASPETGSPVDLFGLIQKTYPVDQNVTEAELELYATGYLINHSFYYRKGSMWSFIYDWFRTELRPTNQVTEAGWIREGDEIAVLQNTADTVTDTQYGQYKNWWQVLGWTLDGDQMTVKCDLGDFERNTNTLINDKTTGINYTIT